MSTLIHVDREHTHIYEKKEISGNCSPVVPPSQSLAYHVHDGEDVGLHVLTPVVLDHLRVSHHQCLHPSLLADGTPRMASAWQVVVPLPLLSPKLLLLGGAKTV